ncbi:HAT2 (YEL056W) [Zygosaccharomyces parabailii]|nr:HAT2 (YEL056W) [Zygosaccharomyces parabailii]CDH11759.1 probable Histone acetyltransferase type B subunit 2 [Zygosaccharomyces bailii ISA1307]
MDSNNQQEKALSVDEEYELWRTNVPLMYDFVSETNLTWPSLTIEWLPGSRTSNKQEMILGTHTSGEEQNYLKIAAIDLPDEVVPDIESNGKEEILKSNVKIVKKFKHDHEVTRARYMPQDSNLVATISGAGTIYLYNRANDADSGLLSTFKFHTENGYGLSFNQNEKGKLVSGSDDSNIAIWDFMGKSQEPVLVLGNRHSDIVNDCKWHNFERDIFGSVSEDNTLQLHDQRVKDACIQKILSKKPYNTLAFSAHSKNLFAAAGTDSMIYLYDRRRPSKPLHMMPGHEDAVTCLEFHPSEDGILISAGSDRRVILWDLAEIGAEQVPDDADDGSPEVMMIHAGHRSSVNDFSVNPNIPWLMASTEEENIVQVWEPSRKLPRVGGIPQVEPKMLE